MNIYADPGSLVRYLGKHGHDYEREAANKILTAGQTYTVKSIEVHGWVSYVTLEEVDDDFNTVMFEDAMQASNTTGE